MSEKKRQTWGYRRGEAKVFDLGEGETLPAGWSDHPPKADDMPPWVEPPEPKGEQSPPAAPAAEKAEQAPPTENKTKGGKKPPP